MALPKRYVIIYDITEVITGKKVYVQGFEIHGASYPAVPGCGK
jgi:hypothetical protein